MSAPASTPRRRADRRRPRPRPRAGAGAARLARDGATAAALLILVLFVIAALWPQLLATRDPAATDYGAVLHGPGPDAWLGTDQLGRDLYTRLVYATRASLFIGAGATVVGLLIGSAIGLTAAVGPRWFDTALMRLTDIGLAFPEILLALLVLAILGPGSTNAMLAIGFGAAPGFARLIRSRAHLVRRSLYVQSARGLGVPPWRIVVRHVLPNSFGPVLVLATIAAGTNIIVAAGLSFLGFGAQPPTAEWGLMLADGRNFLAQAWWIALFPGIAITTTVVVVTVLGRRLEAHLSGEES